MIKKPKEENKTKLSINDSGENKILRTVKKMKMKKRQNSWLERAQDFPFSKKC
jgi:hypothetical protein